MHYRISDFEKTQAEKLKKICHKYPLEQREVDDINEILAAKNIDTLHFFHYEGYDSNFSDTDSNLNVLLICRLSYLNDNSITYQEESYKEILQTDLEREESLQEDESLAQTLGYVHAQASIAIRNAARMPIFKNYFVQYQACPRDNIDFQMSGTSRAKFFSSLSYALSHREEELQKLCLGEHDQSTLITNGHGVPNYPYYELMKYSKSWKIDKLVILGFVIFYKEQDDEFYQNDQLYQNDHIKFLYFSFPGEIDLVKCSIKIINNMKSLRSLKLSPGERSISFNDAKRIFEALKTNNSISNFALIDDVSIGVDQSHDDDNSDEDDITIDDVNIGVDQSDDDDNSDEDDITIDDVNIGVDQSDDDDNSDEDDITIDDVNIGVDQSDDDDNSDENNTTEDGLILYFREQLIQKNKVLESIEFCFDLNIAKNIPNQISLDEALEVSCFLTSIQFGRSIFSSENNQFLKRNLQFSNHLTKINSSLKDGTFCHESFYDFVREKGYNVRDFYHAIQHKLRFENIKLFIEAKDQFYDLFFRASKIKILDLKVIDPIEKYLVDSGDVLKTEITKFDNEQIDHEMITLRILKGDKSFDFSHQNASNMSPKDLEEILRKFFVNSHADIDVSDSYTKEENIVEAKKYVQMLLAANLKSHCNYKNIRETYQQFIDKFSCSSTIDSPSASQLPSLSKKRQRDD